MYIRGQCSRTVCMLAKPLQSVCIVVKQNQDSLTLTEFIFQIFTYTS